MKLFISPNTANLQDSTSNRRRPGWTHEVVSRRQRNADGSHDIGFGVQFYDRHGQEAGTL